MYIAKQITAETTECALILMESLYETLFGTTAQAKPSDVRQLLICLMFPKENVTQLNYFYRGNGGHGGMDFTYTLSYLEKKQCNPVFVPCFIDH